MYLGNVVVIGLHDHHFIDEGWDFKTILILDEHHIMPLEASDPSATCFAEKPDFIAYLWLFHDV